MKEGNVLFNDALNTLYLRLYGVRHMVEDHSEETRCRHMGYSFRLATKVLLYASPHRQNKNITAFVTPVVEHWLEPEIAQWVHYEGSIRQVFRRQSLSLTYLLCWPSVVLEHEVFRRQSLSLTYLLCWPSVVLEHEAFRRQSLSPVSIIDLFIVLAFCSVRTRSLQTPVSIIDLFIVLAFCSVRTRSLQTPVSIIDLFIVLIFCSVRTQTYRLSSR